MNARWIVLLALFASACAMRAPAPQSDRDGVLEAMARAFPRDANLYQLATIDEVGAPAHKVARFEKPAPQGSGPVTRTEVAFCASGEQGWQCMGPWTGVRIAMDGALYSALAPAELEDSRLLALFSYVGSECSASQAEKLGVQWNRGRIRSVDREGKGYVVQMAGPTGFHLLMVEPVATASCAFEIREVSTLTEVVP